MAMKQVPVHGLLASRDDIGVKEFDMAVPLRFPARLFIKEPHFLDQSILAKLRLNFRISRPPVEVSHEQRHPTRAAITAGHTTVSDHNGATTEVASLAVVPVASLLDLVGLSWQSRRRWEGHRWRR
jgi:hypothetical protein